MTRRRMVRERKYRNREGRAFRASYGAFPNRPARRSLANFVLRRWCPEVTP